MEERVTKLEVRVDRLENWRTEESTRAAVADAHFSNLIKRFDNLDSEIMSLKAGIWRVIWAMFAAFSVALVAWIVNGGLAIS
jgi:hypothetical protein